MIEQCINVYKTGVVQRKRVETYQAGQEYTTPRIHGVVFDPNVGRLQRLNVSSVDAGSCHAFLFVQDLIF